LSLQQIRAEIEAGKKKLQNILSQVRASSQAVANDVINMAKNCNQAVQGQNFEEADGGKIPSTDGSADIDSGTDIEVSNIVEQRRVAVVNKGLGAPNMLLSFAREIVMEFYGSSCAKILTQQVNKMYNLDEMGRKMVIVSKLKGIAWLRANATRIMVTAENVLEK